MEFKTKDETAGAMWIVLKYLQPLVQGIEDGVREAGLVIERKRIEQSGDGEAYPILQVRTRGRRRGGWVIELGLRNAIEEFLAVDRDENPASLDLRLFDDAYAERKLSEIVEEQLAILRAVAGSHGADDAKRRLEELAPRFERLRIWRIEGGDSSGER